MGSSDVELALTGNSALAPNFRRVYCAAQNAGSIRGCELVLRLRIKVAGVVALVQLARGLTGKAVDHASAPDSRPLVDHVGPALHVLVLAFYRDFRRGGRDKTPPPLAP